MTGEEGLLSENTGERFNLSGRMEHWTLLRKFSQRGTDI